MNVNILELFQPSRLPEVVDIGANPIDGDPPYKPLLKAQMCRVTGFEPQEDALAKLQAAKSDLERYLPWAVYNGESAKLNICSSSGMTSLLRPDMSHLSLFEILKPCATVLREVEVATRRLDDIDEIEHLDFLKMDIQGGELTVIENGLQKLSSAVVVQLEVSFVTLYEGQPAFGEIDVQMRRMGFMAHSFAAIKRWPIAPYRSQSNPRAAVNQLLEADVVYIRDITKVAAMSDDQLKHLALIGHVCYGSFDLALFCIEQLVARGSIRPDAAKVYPSFVPPACQLVLRSEG